MMSCRSYKLYCCFCSRSYGTHESSAFSKSCHRKRTYSNAISLVH